MKCIVCGNELNNTGSKCSKCGAFHSITKHKSLFAWSVNDKAKVKELKNKYSIEAAKQWAEFEKIRQENIRKEEQKRIQEENRKLEEQRKADLKKAEEKAAAEKKLAEERKKAEEEKKEEQKRLAEQKLKHEQARLAEQRRVEAEEKKRKKRNRIIAGVVISILAIVGTYLPYYFNIVKPALEITAEGSHEIYITEYSLAVNDTMTGENIRMFNYKNEYYFDVEDLVKIDPQYTYVLDTEFIPYEENYILSQYGEMEMIFRVNDRTSDKKYFPVDKKDDVFGVKTVAKRTGITLSDGKKHSNKIAKNLTELHFYDAITMNNRTYLAWSRYLEVFDYTTNNLNETNFNIITK